MKAKNILSFILCCILLLGLCTPLNASAAEPAAVRTVSVLGKSDDGSMWEDADLSWYTDTPDATVFTISTAAEFMGLPTVVNTMGETFNGKTVKLNADIVINEGDADTWTMTTKGLIPWTPIGDSTNLFPDNSTDYASSDAHFAGVFDGQGHVISGIYSLKASNNGLFGMVMRGTVKNFAIVNSAFLNNCPASQGGGTLQAARQGVGSVVNRLNGTVENVYSDANISGSWATGGLVGYMQYNATVKNSVYAGKIDLTSCGMGGGGLYGVDDKATKPVHTPSVTNCALFADMTIHTYYGSELDPTGTVKTSRNGRTLGLIGGSAQAMRITDVYVDATVGGTRDLTHFSVLGKVTVDTTKSGSVYVKKNENLFVSDIAVHTHNGNMPSGLLWGDMLDSRTGQYTELFWGIPSDYMTISHMTFLTAASVSVSDLAGFTASEWSVYDGRILPVGVAAMLSTHATAEKEIVRGVFKLSATLDELRQELASAIESARADVTNALGALQTAVNGKADSAVVNERLAELAAAISRLETLTQGMGGTDRTGLDKEVKLEIADAKAAMLALIEEHDRENALTRNRVAEFEGKLNALRESHEAQKQEKRVMTTVFLAAVSVLLALDAVIVICFLRRKRKQM